MGIHIFPAIPRLNGEAHGCHLLQHLPLLCGQRGVRITTTARLQGIDDVIHLVTKHTQGIHPRGKDIRDGLRGTENKRYGTIPDTFG